jgi:anion-transporting  ArsA/GET3 family ATPase
MERRRDPDGRFVYDLIVVDAPATGRILNFLQAPEATTELVAVGPIREQARSLIDMLLDPSRLRIQLVTLLEEMPVAETLDSAVALEALGVALNPIITNRVLRPQFDVSAAKIVETLSAPAVQRLADRVGLDGDGTAETLLRLAVRHLRRLSLQDDMRTTLDERLRVPSLELPYLPTRTFGERELGQLADIINEAGE